jgi:hypothetical protein
MAQIARMGELGDYENDRVFVYTLISELVMFVRIEIQRIIERPREFLMSPNDDYLFQWWVNHLRLFESFR